MLASSATPKPNIISASGMKAMAGMGRKASMVGPVTCSSSGKRPSATPVKHADDGGDRQSEQGGLERLPRRQKQ